MHLEIQLPESQRQLGKQFDYAVRLLPDPSLRKGTAYTPLGPVHASLWCSLWCGVIKLAIRFVSITSKIFPTPVLGGFEFSKNLLNYCYLSLRNFGHQRLGNPSMQLETKTRCLMKKTLAHSPKDKFLYFTVFHVVQLNLIRIDTKFSIFLEIFKNRN